MDQTHTSSSQDPAGSAGPGWWRNWKSRHQHPVSFGLHAVGIPLTLAAVVLAIMQLADSRWDLWWRPASLLAAGYLLQWIGHVIEGNTMGEVIVVCRWLGRPYVAVSPRYAARPHHTASEHTDDPHS